MEGGTRARRRGAKLPRVAANARQRGGPRVGCPGPVWAAVSLAARPSLRPKRALGGLVLAEWGHPLAVPYHPSGLPSSRLQTSSAPAPAPAQSTRPGASLGPETALLLPLLRHHLLPSTLADCCVARRRFLLSKASSQDTNFRLFCIPPLFRPAQNDPSLPRPCLSSKGQNQTLPSAALRAGRSM